jgi:hypothetical protein
VLSRDQRCSYFCFRSRVLVSNYRGQFFIRQVRAPKDASSRRRFARPASKSLAASVEYCFSCPRAQAVPLDFILPLRSSVSAPDFRSRAQSFRSSSFSCCLRRLGSVPCTRLFFLPAGARHSFSSDFSSNHFQQSPHRSAHQDPFPSPDSKARRRFSVSRVQVLVPTRSLVLAAQCALVSDFDRIRSWFFCEARWPRPRFARSRFVFYSCRPRSSRLLIL